jgi:hypothetical protein
VTKRVHSAAHVVDLFLDGYVTSRNMKFETARAGNRENRMPLLLCRRGNEESALHAIATGPDGATVAFAHRGNLKLKRGVGIGSDGDFRWLEITPVGDALRKTR